MNHSIETEEVPEKISYTKLIDTTLLFTVNKNHPLAKKEVISFSDLKDTPLILMKEDSLQSSLVQNAFEKHSITPNIKIRTNQLYTIKELIKNNILGAFMFIEPLMTKVTRFLLHSSLD